MIRYLPGILLVQLVTLSLLWVNRDAALTQLLTNVALPAIVVSSVIALWFSAISRMDTQRAHTKLVEKHFAEREKLTRTLERSRSDLMQQASADQAKIMERAGYEREELVRKTHQDMIKAERRASRSANMKVGAAFTLVTVAGVGLLFVQLMTLGLLTITAASGALGGYLLRWKQTRHVMQLASDNTRGKGIAQDTEVKLVSNESSKALVIDASNDSGSDQSKAQKGGAESTRT